MIQGLVSRQEAQLLPQPIEGRVWILRESISIRKRPIQEIALSIFFMWTSVSKGTSITMVEAESRFICEENSFPMDILQRYKNILIVEE